MELLADFRAWLIDYYIAAGVLLLAIAILMAFTRQPARRIAVGWAAVGGLSLLAVLTAIPQWPRLHLGVRVSAARSASETAGDAGDAGDAGAGEPRVSDQGVAAPEAGSEPLRDESGDSSGAQAGRSVRRAGARSDVVDWKAATTLLFLAGASGIAWWLVVGALLTRALRYHSRLAPEPVQRELTRLGGSRAPATRVLLSDRINQALALGFWKPQIILPERFLGGESCEALEAALVHELAHVRNGDLRMLACLRWLMVPLFAHPLYWWFRAQIRMDQELLADAAAGARSDGAAYAEILLDWFRTNAADRGRAVTATLGLWEKPHLLKRRISMLLNQEISIEARSPVSWRIASWLMLICGACALSVVTLRENAVADSGDDSTPTRQTSPATPQPANDSPEKPREPATHSKYQSADDAFRAGAALHNANKFAESRRPFEAALQLAPDDKFRIKVYEALKPAYRQLGNPDKMIAACDFILRHSDFEPKRSLTRRDLLSFVHQRGKVNQLITLYETKLEADKQDRTALYVLSELYDRIKRDPRRAAELTKRLLALGNGEGSVDVAVTAKLAALYVRQSKYREGAMLYEKIAPLDKHLAAWHWKEAAAAWLKVKDFDKALAAAKTSAASSPENRSQQLEHFWHRALGEVFLATGEPKLAVTHLQKAIDNTTIEGYLVDCRKLLEQAQTAAN